MLWLWVALVATASSYPTRNVLPHCSRTIAMESELRDYRGGNESQPGSSVQFIVALHETACISVVSNETGRFIHALEFHRLEQHHPVSGKYQFGIPKITPSCICDCAGGDVHCKLDEYNYKNCTSGSVCYRTYYPAQSNTGCGFGEQKSEVCCQLKIDPFKDWTFTAIRVGQADTVAIFKYSIFERMNGEWRGVVEQFVEVPMNKGNTRFELKDKNRLEISVTGSRPNREVTPGMYFVRDGIKEVRSGVPMNDIVGADLSKLGWMRYTDGKWVVPNGPIKMKEKFHVDVKDCKAQRYTSTFNGEQLVMVAGEEEMHNFDLGQAISDDPWIERATYDNRVVRVEHAEGIALTVQMISDFEIKNFRPIHHASQFKNFSGSIKLDRNSNRYMNATFQDAKGTFVGYIYSSEGKEHVDMVLTISVDSSIIRNYTTTVTVPPEINSSRYVCFHPMGDDAGQVCQWFVFEEQQLSSFTVANKWHTGQGNCNGCNEIGVDAVWAALDPRSWFDGINSPKEALAAATEIVLTGVMLLAFICLCTKCFIPLARCTLSIPRPLKK